MLKELSEHAAQLQGKLIRFMEEYIYPNEQIFEAQLNEGKIGGLFRRLLRS